MSFISSEQTVVLKLGGSVVQKLEDFSNLATLVKLYKAHYHQVVVVISALKGYTDNLLSQAKLLSPTPPSRELDMLASVGERIAASLLCIALNQIEIGAKSYTGSQAGILTSNDHTQAKILDITPLRIQKSLQEHQVVVIAGFQGVSQQNKEITTLGRGGSDTTAVAMGIALKAQRIVFFKDTGGLFDADPKMYPAAKSLSFCNYEHALELMKTPKFALHPRAVELAQKNKLPLHICSVEQPMQSSTLIAENPFYTDKIDFTKAAIYE